MSPAILPNKKTIGFLMISGLVIGMFLFPTLTPVNQNAIAADPSTGKKVAFVKPTFTGAAYNNAFYDFYDKYKLAGTTQHITTDLQMLTGTIPSGSNTPANNTQLYNGVPVFSSHTSSVFPNAVISTITDADIHSGAIFTGGGANAYDVLVFFHNEYETQQEYNNLKTFTSQGGVVMFLDGNIFYAEVAYNAAAQNVTLVKGHAWYYNQTGGYAVKSADERWPTENTQYFGALYYDAYLHTYPNGTFIYQYQNDPFNYGPVRFEDNQVTNPDNFMILNYALNQPGVTVATYWKPYGNGRIIDFGIYSEKVMSNPTYLSFYDSVLTTYAFQNPAPLPSGCI